MMFDNRVDAARRLLPLLEKWKKDECLVLAIPRGGVPLACHIARYLHCPVDLIMVKKITMPGQDEFAVGAVSMDGKWIDDRYSISQAYIEKETSRIQQQFTERYYQLTGRHYPADVSGKTILLIDDGIATGNTMAAAIRFIRARHASTIVVVAPVASHEAWLWMKQLADDVVCLAHSADFKAVGQYYADFSQVEDEEVTKLLASMPRAHQ